MGKRKKADQAADQATLDLLVETVDKLVDEVERLKRRIATIEAKPDPFRPIGPVTPWIEPTTPPPPPWKHPETHPWRPREPIITYSNSSDPESTPHQ